MLGDIRALGLTTGACLQRADRPRAERPDPPPVFACGVNELRLTLNPDNDLAFASAAKGFAREAGDIADLQRRLRVAFPNAVVRARGLAGERDGACYVYRDGHWASRR